MATRIERKSRFKKKHIYSLIGIAVGLLCLLWLLFRDTSSSLKVEKERITIATVQKGEFNDYIRVIGQVLPDRIIYLDAIEGGRVEERLIEEGAQVRAGDVILRLSNPLHRHPAKRSRLGLSGKRTSQHPSQHGAGTSPAETGPYRPE